MNDLPAISYTGAAVFWLYIVAALLFTALTIQTITRLPKPMNDATKEKVRIFIALAVFSFTTLSVNMLHVLIQSYNFWSARQSGTRPNSLTTLIHSIGTWSAESSLFLDFGNAIVASARRSVWTQSALLLTYGNCVFMAGEGKDMTNYSGMTLPHLSNQMSLPGHRRNIPRLWTFAALSQILPISFAQNLCYIALLHRPDERDTTTAVPLQTLLPSLVTYAWLVSTAIPQAVQTGGTLPIILATRTTLLLPLVLSKEVVSTYSPASRTSVTARYFQTCVLALAVAFGMYQTYIATVAGHSLASVFLGLFDHPAVTSLGMDFIISVFSFGVWQYYESGDTWRSVKAQKFT